MAAYLGPFQTPNREFPCRRNLRSGLFRILGGDLRRTLAAQEIFHFPESFLCLCGGDRIKPI